MLILGFKPEHDGAVAAIQDRELLYSLEPEKDSFPRYSALTPTSLFSVMERLGDVPDVVALGGWGKPSHLGNVKIGTGYPGHGADAIDHRVGNFLGKTAVIYQSSHERSHLLMSVGMAPRDDFETRVVLIWEGAIGDFYVLDDKFSVVRHVPVMSLVGYRYSLLYALADPTFPEDQGLLPRHEDAGKLMALAAFGDPRDADRDVVDLVENVLTRLDIAPAPKAQLRDSPLYNIGVEAEATKIAAALLTQRVFERFSIVAQHELPAGVPLHISGGCGLNCDWNRMWRDLSHFSSVFVPPCTNDSGSALGTAIDALTAVTGDPYIDWNVYCGLEFEWDCEPDSSSWVKRKLDMREAARALREGRVFAWAQGRWELGPRALGSRSLLASATDARTRDRLNHIKQREDYRPIAPCCRVEDLGKAFDTDFEDPYMLYFRMVTSDALGAVTHVDGTARCQTVSRADNPLLHELLTAVSAQTGLGVLCNTSLNFKGFGFINRMTDLARYCEDHDVDDMVVGDAWFERKDRSAVQRQAAELAEARG